jgi:hypothetical protein
MNRTGLVVRLPLVLVRGRVVVLDRRAFHGVRLPSAGLAVAEDGAIVAFKHFLQNWRNGALSSQSGDKKERTIIRHRYRVGKN